MQSRRERARRAGEVRRARGPSSDVTFTDRLNRCDSALNSRSSVFCSRAARNAETGSCHSSVTADVEQQQGAAHRQHRADESQHGAPATATGLSHRS